MSRRVVGVLVKPDVRTMVVEWFVCGSDGGGRRQAAWSGHGDVPGGDSRIEAREVGFWKEGRVTAFRIRGIGATFIYSVEVGAPGFIIQPMTAVAESFGQVASGLQCERLPRATVRPLRASPK